MKEAVMIARAGEYATEFDRIRAHRLQSSTIELCLEQEPILSKNSKFSAQHNSEGIGLEREFLFAGGEEPCDYLVDESGMII